MFGLSVTGIGMRPIETCVDIFYKLQEDMMLNYLELAIGSHTTTENAFKMPVVLHDRVLYVNESNRYIESKSRRLDYFTYKDDLDYISQFCKLNKVLALSLHPPKKHLMSLSKVDKRIKQIEDILGLPVYLETLYKEEDWYSDIESIGKSKLLVDVSHINIWTRNNKKQTEVMVNHILDNYDVGMIHLSDNNGSRDSHDLIKPEAWFNKYLGQWSHKYMITWESLPIQHSYYERLDKNKREDRYGKVI